MESTWRCGQICGQKQSFVNSVVMYDAQFTQKSNQAAFCWSEWQICMTSLNLLQNLLSDHTQIPIEITILSVKFAKQYMWPLNLLVKNIKVCYMKYYSSLKSAVEAA